jgi:hypothetical protein
MNHDQELQLIAYHIWEEQGHPHGCDVEHWLKAESVWQEKHERETLPVLHVTVPQKAASNSQAKAARTQPRPFGQVSRRPSGNHGGTMSD